MTTEQVKYLLGNGPKIDKKVKMIIVDNDRKFWTSEDEINSGMYLIDTEHELLIVKKLEGQNRTKTVHYIPFDTIQGIATVDEGQAIVPSVMIGGQMYMNMASAVKNAKDGDTIKLIANIDDTDSKNPKIEGNTNIVIENKNLTIDLNGKTWKADGYTSVIYCKGKSNVTIADSVGTGVIHAFDNRNEDNDTYLAIAVWVRDEANVVIKGGTFKQSFVDTSRQYNYDLIYLGPKTATNANITIEGGTFYCMKHESINVQNDLVKAGKTITIKGGKFIGGVSPFDENSKEFTVPEGYEAKQNGNMWIVTKK